MVAIKEYEGFRIFEPSEDIIPESRRKMDASISANRKFLSKNPRKKRPGISITGTFIYAHAPDYVGNYTLNWDRSKWNDAFRTLREKGIDTVIFQASAWNELREVYYKSSEFGSFKCWNVVEPMLEAAGENRLSVFLGGYGSISGWKLDLTEGAVGEEIRHQCACFKELMTFRELFDGFYYAPETAFKGVRDISRERKLHSIYRTCLQEIKEMAPEKKVMMAPASGRHRGKEQDFVEFWHDLLAGIPLDILAPQDSVGCAGCKLEDMSEMWSLWRTTADSVNVSLWADIELFERTGFGGPAPFKSADPERILFQCGAVEPFVEKCVCWEALFFDLP